MQTLNIFTLNPTMVKQQSRLWVSLETYPVIHKKIDVYNAVFANEPALVFYVNETPIGAIYNAKLMDIKLTILDYVKTFCNVSYNDIAMKHYVKPSKNHIKLV